MALRPGDVVAYEFSRAPGRALSRPVDPFVTVHAHRIGQVIVVTDLSFRLVAVAHAVTEGRKDGQPLVVIVGRDEYGDWSRARNRRPAARRASRRYGQRKRARA